MKYRNIHNGRIIDIPSQLSSPDWERLDGGNSDKKPKTDEAVRADEPNKRKGVRRGK